MPLATLVRNPNLRVPNLIMDLNHMTVKNAADFVLLPWTPRLPFATEIPKAIVPALCLCCKRTGHKFSDCTEDTMPVGIPTYSRYFDSKLTLHSNSSIIFCITFQLNSAKHQCKTDHPSRHACSWCGSSDHGACSQKCI